MNVEMWFDHLSLHKPTFSVFPQTPLLTIEDILIFHLFSETYKQLTSIFCSRIYKITAIIPFGRHINLSHDIFLLTTHNSQVSRSDTVRSRHDQETKWAGFGGNPRPECAARLRGAWRQKIWRDFLENLKYKIWVILSLCPLITVGSDLAWECDWTCRPNGRGLINGSSIDGIKKQDDFR